MVNPDLLDDFCVLLLEESPVLQLLFDDWLSGITTRITSTPVEIPRMFDGRVAAASLSQSALGKNVDETLKQILSWNPYCQLVAILPRSSHSWVHQEDYDASLQRPIYKNEFRETIANRLACGVYSAKLHEFYTLNATYFARRQAENSNDPSPEVDGNQLQERYGKLCSQLDSLKNILSAEDIRSISQSISLHKKYLTQPTEQVYEGSGSKYYPSRCPKCKLPWGVDHGAELKKGVESVGAGVWRCARCSEIVHGLSDSGRRIFQG